MFDSLSERLQGVFGELRGHGKLSEADIDKAMREIRLALLEADVNFKVVREFVNHVKERALGAEVIGSLTPAQQVVKVAGNAKALGGNGKLGDLRLRRAEQVGCPHGVRPAYGDETDNANDEEDLSQIRNVNDPPRRQGRQEDHGIGLDGADGPE